MKFVRQERRGVSSLGTPLQTNSLAQGPGFGQPDTRTISHRESLFEWIDDEDFEVALWTGASERTVEDNRRTAGFEYY